MNTLINFLLFSLLCQLTTTTPIIGVTHQFTTNVPEPTKVVEMLTILKIKYVRLLDPTPRMIYSFSDTKISLLIVIPNSIIPTISSNISEASLWIRKHVIPFHPKVLITAISLGTHYDDNYSSSSEVQLLPAIRNIRSSLYESGIHNIDVSTTLAYSTIVDSTSSLLPSSTIFNPQLSFAIKPLFEYLKETSSPVFITLYPYHLFQSKPGIPLGFALFENYTNTVLLDPKSGISYHNLYDVMVDSIFRALASLNHGDIPVVVAETGWPCFDALNLEDATPAFSNMYLKGLIKHISLGNHGTGKVIGVYIYRLFDETSSSNKPEMIDHGTGEQWGFCHANATMKFKMSFCDDCPTSTKPVVSKDNAFPIFLAVIMALNVVWTRLVFQRAVVNETPRTPTRL